MKQLRKGTLKFDAFRAFAAFGANEKVPIGDPALLTEFIEKAKQVVSNSLENPAFLHGHRTQSMFAGLVLSLGEAKFLKQEDEGDCFTNLKNAEIPDFRIVLPDDEHWLVEVKNYYQVNPLREFRMKVEYLDGLEAYAGVMRCPLKIAIYWARWGLWSLVPSCYLKREGDWASIKMGDAMMHNELSVLGDLNIGTTAPLRLTQFVTPISAPVAKVGELSFQARVDRLELQCNGNLIEDRVEKNIALFLMFFGRWKLASSPRTNGSKIIAIEHEWCPETPTSQGFDIIGSLSEMHSKHYLMTTSNFAENAITQIHVTPNPGVLGQLIPKDYKGKALPLWRLMIQANHSISDATAD